MDNLKASSTATDLANKLVSGSDGRLVVTTRWVPARGPMWVGGRESECRLLIARIQYIEGLEGRQGASQREFLAVGSW